MADPLDMTGKVALVTGGAKGAGRGITEAFLEHGAEVMTCGRSRPEALPEVNGRSARFIEADVRDVDQIAAVISGTLEAFDRLDVVVNNAGGTPPASVAGASPRFLTSIITLNLIAPLLVAQQANDVMQGQDGGGSIINIASVNGLRAAPLTAAYGAAKAGLLNLTESLAVEWGPKVRVNAVTAGIIGSEEMFALHYDSDGEFVASLTRQIPMGRMTTGADVGGVCLFLASPLAQQISGANILVHGGAEPAGSTGAG